jgi:hypothetical protein
MPVSAEPRRLGQLLASPIKWAPNYRAEKLEQEVCHIKDVMATTGLAALRRYAKSLTSMRCAHLKGAGNITMIEIDFSNNAFGLVGSEISGYLGRLPATTSVAG